MVYSQSSYMNALQRKIRCVWEQCPTLTSPYVGVARASCMEGALCPAYVTVPT